MTMSTTSLQAPDAIDTLAPACGVIVATDGNFKHVATCWSMAPGEWVTVLADDQAVPSADWRLILAADGSVHEMTEWDIDGVVAGFKAAAAPQTLTIAGEGHLRKRQTVQAFAYPEVIDHPAIALHRASLDADRYFPYLCPWRLSGHIALLSVETCFLAGATYPGMRGGPVLDADGAVVGILGEAPAAGSLPLTPFWRLC